MGNSLITELSEKAGRILGHHPMLDDCDVRRVCKQDRNVDVVRDLSIKNQDLVFSRQISVDPRYWRIVRYSPSEKVVACLVRHEEAPEIHSKQRLHARLK